MCVYMYIFFDKSVYIYIYIYWPSITNNIWDLSIKFNLLMIFGHWRP